ncbi:hypothetical protein LTR50_003780 [Elasticomyces elasticus]|nr:hypothetical protein LTR50_003780 [Elasticomyces elasticus]
MSDEPRKRSRFDQTEPDPKRAPRFERRSRSPSRRAAETNRSRSPIDRTMADSGTPKRRPDATAAAAAAAARINAQIQAKRSILHVEVPPIRSTQSPANAQSPSASANGTDNDMYTQDGDYIKDIEVNDLRNRYTLTKGSTQKMVTLLILYKDVTTRGSYYPDKSMATAANPPLYLHVTSTTKDGLEKAVKKIEELMQQELPNLVDERRFRRREPDPVERDSFGRRKWPEEKIPVDLEPIPGFNLRAQVVGHQGSYVKHIQGETRCRVQIKGRGSGFIEHDTGNESDEQMYLHVAGPDPNEVQRAKELCLDLLANVTQQYEQFKERGPRHDYHDHGDRGDRGDRYGGGDRYNHRDRDRNTGSYGGGGYNNGGYNNSGYGDLQSPIAPQAASVMSPGGTGAAEATTAETQAAWAAYYAQGGQDPYAAYGGYQNYYNMYMQQYYGQQAAGTQSSPAPGVPGAPNGSAPPPPPPASSAPPPPPPDNQPPPPPPPGAEFSGYNAVPPPPGM